MHRLIYRGWYLLCVTSKKHKNTEISHTYEGRSNKVLKQIADNKPNQMFSVESREGVPYVPLIRYSLLVQPPFRCCCCCCFWFWCLHFSLFGRGFETVTYMLQGTIEHEDFCGHRYVMPDFERQTACCNIHRTPMSFPFLTFNFPSFPFTLVYLKLL